MQFRQVIQLNNIELCNDQLHNLKFICQQYTSNLDYAFMHYRGLLIVLKKIGTKTTPVTKKICNTMFATFKGDTFLIVSMIDMQTAEIMSSTFTQIYHSCFGYSRTYKIGEKLTMYHPHIGNIKRNGVEYYNSIERAFFDRESPLRYSGFWFDWYDNGHKRKIEEYEDGVVINSIFFYYTGQLGHIKKYIDGVIHMKTWHPNAKHVSVTGQYVIDYKLKDSIMNYVPEPTGRDVTNYHVALLQMGHKIGHTQIGTWTYYDADGNVEKTIFFDPDRESQPFSPEPYDALDD